MAITQKQKEELLRQLESPNQQVREAAIKEIAAITGNTNLLKNISSKTREAVQQASEDLNLVKVEESSTQKQKEVKPNLKPQVLQQEPAEETMPVFINQENQSETATPAPQIPTIPQTHIPNNESQSKTNTKPDLPNFGGAAKNKATNFIRKQASNKLSSQGLGQMFQGGLKQGLNQAGKTLMTNATAAANAAVGAASGAASAVGGAAGGVASSFLGAPVAIAAAAIGAVVIGLIIAFIVYIISIFTITAIFFVINTSGYLVPPNQYGSVQSGGGGVTPGGITLPPGCPSPSWPVDTSLGQQYYLSQGPGGFVSHGPPGQPFGYILPPYEAIDIAPRISIPIENRIIYSIHSGKITELNRDASGGNAKYVSLTADCGANFISRYVHMDSINPDLSYGQTIPAGTFIGIMGCTGFCSGTHLHYEFRNSDVTLKIRTENDPPPYMNTPYLPQGIFFNPNAAGTVNDPFGCVQYSPFKCNVTIP